MNIDPTKLIEEDEDTWVIEEFTLNNSRPPVKLSFYLEEEKPNSDQTNKIKESLESIEALVLRASELILDNYSKEHFRKLGVSEDRLAEDTSESIAKAVTLYSIYVFDLEEIGFELSFSAPWDDHHSFDVEFEGSNAISCSVNG